MDEPNNVKPFLRRVDTPPEIKLHGVAAAAAQGKYVIGGDSTLAVADVIRDIQDRKLVTFLLSFICTPKTMDDIVVVGLQYLETLDAVAIGNTEEIREHVQHAMHNLTMALDLDHQKFIFSLTYIQTPFGGSFSLTVHDMEGNETIADTRYSDLGINFMVPEPT